MGSGAATGRCTTVRTQEAGVLLRSWRHTLHVETTDASRCRHSDTVAIDARAPTLLVRGFVEVLVRGRHRRWQHLARAVPAGS